MGVGNRKSTTLLTVIQGRSRLRTVPLRRSRYLAAALRRSFIDPAVDSRFPIPIPDEHSIRPMDHADGARAPHDRAVRGAAGALGGDLLWRELLRLRHARRAR